MSNDLVPWNSLKLEDFRTYIMTLETLPSTELPAFLIYDTISATPFHHSDPSSQSFISNELAPAVVGGIVPDLRPSSSNATAAQERRKRRRRQRSCKNKEEAESQRMAHIAVERNRRRQMNEHLAVLRSLMPDSYIQRGDQASIVGGAIDFVKELEQLLQSLEAQKRTLQQQRNANNGAEIVPTSSKDECELAPFAHFFAYPQYVWCHPPKEYPPSTLAPESRAAVADIEVTLIETHANLRILSPRRPRQLLRMVAGLQTLRLSILHLNVTTLDSMVLYSISAKVEEGCNLTTVDDIAAAVHHMLSMIEAEQLL